MESTSLLSRLLLTRDGHVHVPAPVPRVGLVVNTILSMVTIAVLAVCFTRRFQSIKQFHNVPLTRWILFAIYVDSMVFITTTAIVYNGFGVNTNLEICSSTILLCLTCYLSTKLIYYFLVEKVYIIRRVSTPRLRSKLYCFNCFGMLLPYIVVVVLNYIYRISYLRDDGVCIIGMQKRSMLPLIIFDAVVNFYLTMLFVMPLRGMYSYKNSPQSALRTIALRSFFGALATLTSSVVNLTVLMVLHGEPAWVCLMLCNADTLFSVLVLHWVTSKDASSNPSSARSRSNQSRIYNSQANKHVNPFAGSIGRDGKQGTATVTTHISAMGCKEDEDRDEAELQRVRWGKRGSVEADRIRVRENEERGAAMIYPMNSIRIEVGHSVEVESQSQSRVQSINENAEDLRTMGRVRSQSSTDDLVFGRKEVV